MKAPITVFVLTLNEEHYIRRCLEQLTSWAGEVLVVDSQSTDRTREIAEAAGARVIVQPWLGWVGQHHCAMDAARFDWCFKVDADEIVGDELAAAASAAILRDPDPRTGFVVERIEEFCSVLMPNTRRQSKRDTFVRLMHRKFSRYDPTMLIHEEIVCAGPRVRLPGTMLHWRDFDLTARFTQDNRNATLEAQMLARQGARWSAVRLTVKPLLRFLWVYLWSGAWRAGSHGLVYSLSRAMAEFMRQAKLWEAQAVEHVRHPPRETYSRASVNIDPVELADGR
ncbi:MAG: glycosyltransferase family 2 protein [Gammaproteobacteria bacterium]